MNESEQGVPPGWHVDQNGDTRWWTGTGWGPLQCEPAPAAPTTGAEPPAETEPSLSAARPSQASTASSASGLNILAIVLAVIIAPVGLVLGIVAMRKAKKGQGSNALALIATIVGAALTLVLAAVTALVFFVGSQIQAEADRAEFCEVGYMDQLYAEWAEASPQVDLVYSGSGELLSMYDQEMLSMAIMPVSTTLTHMRWYNDDEVRQTTWDVDSALLEISEDAGDPTVGPDDRPGIDTLLTYVDDAHANVCNR